MIKALKWKKAEMIEQSEQASREAPEKLVRTSKKKVFKPMKTIDTMLGGPSLAGMEEPKNSSSNARAIEKNPIVEVRDSPPTSPRQAGDVIWP